MSRLDYAPNLKEIQITDIRKGIGVFTPKPDRPVSLTALKVALKKAGYTLDTAEINVTGTLERDGDKWVLVNTQANQRFALEGAEAEKIPEGMAAGTRVELTGEWETVGAGTSERESIRPRTLKKAAPAVGRVAAPLRFLPAGYGGSPARPLAALPAEPPDPTRATPPLAPIRTTSPGLTVFRGGAVVPRLYLARQSLGNLDVSRQRLQVSASYTPSQRVQLEAEVPFSRTSFDNGAESGSAFGLGNVTLWGKYRFFRAVQTFGDRQAAARFGLELPTGRKEAPGAAELNAPEFVRHQLTPISGGLSAHFDASYSQARRRVIFGGNVEAVVRSERGGFRMGHEVRVNTDLEYVLLPRKYENPGGEVFVILETTFAYRGLGRVHGSVVPDTRSTEYFLAPGVQYAAAPRWVIEGSYQIPVVRHTGAQVLRNGGNLLIGIRYLY